MKIGFLGAGNMGEALARGVIDAVVAESHDVLLFDVAEERVQSLATELGATRVPSAPQLVVLAEVVVFAVKPQNMPELLAELRADTGVQGVVRERLFISICAGTTIGFIEQGLVADPAPGEAPPRVVRVMPNTPALIGAGAAALAGGASATEKDVAFALRMMRGVGIAEQVEEKDLDAVTALSGSGPAYVFRLIEAMQEAGAQQGLAPEVARRLTLQTVFGAAKMAAEKADTDTAELRRRVTSPGGTTAAGLAVLDERGFFEAVGACVAAATERGRELGRAKG